MTKLSLKVSFGGCILTSSATLTGTGVGAEAATFTSSVFGATLTFKLVPELKDVLIVLLVYEAGVYIELLVSSS